MTQNFNNNNEYNTGQYSSDPAAGSRPEISAGAPDLSESWPDPAAGQPGEPTKQASANAAKKRRRKKARRRRRRTLLAVLVVLLLLLIPFGKTMYDRHTAPSTPEAFIECLEAEQYDTCATIAKKMAGDRDFVETIGRPIQKEASAACSRYADGEADSASTLERLETLNRASAGLFADTISSQIDSVRDLDDLYNSISSVSDLVKQGNMEGLQAAYEILASAKEKGAALGTNPDWILGTVINNNIDGLKYYLFSRYAEEVQLGRSGYAFIEESASFINAYAEDPDLTNYLSVMSGLQKGWHSPLYAADEARTAAAAAEEQWRAAIAE